MASASRALLSLLRTHSHSPSVSLSSFKCLFSLSSSSSTSITRPPPLPTFRPVFPISHAVNIIPTRMTTIRCRVNRSGGSYSPVNNNIPSSSSNFSDRPPTEIAPLFPGCDYEHWLIVMDKPGGEGANKQQMIDCYVQTLARVLGRRDPRQM